MPQAKNIFLFSIDGMRPDAMQQAATPNIDKLIASGTATMKARTVMPSCTLPCHMSMFHGVPPERHGINTNDYHPQVHPIQSTIDALHAAGIKTIAAYNWEELRDLWRPASIDLAYFINDNKSEEGDHAVADFITANLSGNPAFYFVYLGYVDEAGHAHGWMTDEYIASIESADVCVGKVVNATLANNNADETIFIVTADHGGHDKTHGTDSDEDMLIPMIFSGAKIPAGKIIDRELRIFDLPATITTLMGVDPEPDWTGKPITEIMQ